MLKVKKEYIVLIFKNSGPGCGNKKIILNTNTIVRSEYPTVYQIQDELNSIPNIEEIYDHRITIEVKENYRIVKE